MKQRILAALVVTLLVLSLVPAFLSTPVYASSMTFYPGGLTGGDTYIESGVEHENTNFGSETLLRVGHYQSIAPPYPAWTDRTLLEFQTWYGNPIPVGSTIISAYLQVYYYDYDGSNPAGDVLLAQRLLRYTWQEMGATWNNYAAGYVPWDTAGAAGVNDYTASGQISAVVPSSYGWVNFDVTTHVQWAFSNYRDTLFRVVAANENLSKLLYFYSSEYEDPIYRPRLILNYIPATKPTVGTIGADTISYNSAECYGKIIESGTATVTTRGFKYGLTQTDTWDKHETGSFGTGDFSLSLTGLISSTTYWFRAYATNSYGTGYGPWETFTAVVGIPIVTTGYAYVYGYGCDTYASMGGTVVNIGNSTVTRRGFEWGLSPLSPSYDKYETGSFGTGNYTLEDSASGNLSYWFRAYATNTEGTGYGIWKPFWVEDYYPGAGCEGGGGANVTGSGTLGDPYVIWSDYGLQEMQNYLSSYWELGCNIDASNTSTWNGGAGFVPVGTFSGHFDGNYHAITGLYEDINVATSCVFGLFSTIQSATIQNLYILDADLSGYATGSDVSCFGGILAGQALGAATISRVITSGIIYVNGYDTYSIGHSASAAGGLIGFSYGGLSISQTASTANVTAIAQGYTFAYAGGLEGHLSTEYYGGATISNCYARGNAYGSRAAGGLIGQTYIPYSSITTDNCYSTGTVSGTYPNFSGGLNGYTGGTVTDSFWDTQTSLMSGSHGGTGKVTAEMTTNSTFIDAGWDFDTIWALDWEYGIVEDGYPYFGWALAGSDNATQYTLTLSSTTNGDVTDPGEGEFTYDYGTTVDLVATPDEGYQFALWTGDISEIADVHDATTTVTVNGDYTIVAVFVLEGELALVISSTDGGDVTDPGEGVFSYDYEDIVDLTATADGGYSFAVWTGDMDTLDDVHNATTTIEMLDDYTIVGNFVTTGNYALVISSSDGGDVIDPGEGLFEYSPSTVVNLMAQPNPGAWFAEWTGNVTTIGDVYNATTNITMSSNYSITAVFESGTGQCTLTITGDIPQAGESYNLTAYYVYPTGSSGSPENYPEWQGNVTTYVEYEADLITAYVQEQGINGTMPLVSVEAFELDTTYFDEGGALRKGALIEALELLPSWANSDVQVVVGSWDAGTNAEAMGTTTFMYLATIEADVKAMEGDPDPIYANRVYCELAHEMGHVFSCWDHCSNKPCPMAQQYITYTEWVNMGETLWFCGEHTTLFLNEWQQELPLNEDNRGGHVTVPGEGVFAYDCGTEVELVATPDEGYEFTGWEGNVDTIVDILDPTTTITVNGDYTITATFLCTSEGMYSLTVSTTDGGNVTIPGEGVFAYPTGTVVDLVAVPEAGYWFHEWTGDIGSIANSLSFNTTISMYGNYAITANFALEEEPPVGAPTVVTNNATSITAISATLQGSLTGLGNYTLAYVFFQYGLNTTYGTNTPEQTRTSTGNFSRSINDLSANTTYHFRAVARYGSYVYGEDGNFTTSATGPVEPPGYEYQPCGDTYKYEAYEAGDNETAVVYGANWFFETFTPVEAFKISSVRLKVFKTGTPGALTVSIRNVDSVGKPTGIDLTSATSLDTGTSVGWYEIVLPTYRLELKEYAVVVRAVAGDAANYIGWQYDGTGSYTGGAYGSSSDSGVSWSVDEDKDFMFQTFGSTVLCIMDAKVFSGYLETGDWLITISYLNEFPPYYGVATASDYFNLQLIANGDLVASVGVPLWGNMPGSIYMSKALADTLEWGSTYTVRMRGTFDPYPTSTWTLIPPDWRGTDLTRLDAWVFEVASIMSTYYGQLLTVYSNNVNKLNDAGSALFAGGIPMLAALRGHLFVSPELYAPYTEASSAETSHWQEYFGPKIAADAATAGNVFGFSGIQFVQVVFFGLWFGASIVIAIVAGGAAFLVSIPFFMIGVMTDVVPKAGIAVVGAIFVLILVWYFWLRST